MRRAQHANTLRAESCEHRIHIVGPHDDLGSRRAHADCHIVHVPQGLDRRQPEDEPVKTQLNMDWRAPLRRAERLGEPEQVAIEADRGLDVLDIEVDLRCAEHQVIISSASASAGPCDAAPIMVGRALATVPPEDSAQNDRIRVRL